MYMFTFVYLFLWLLFDLHFNFQSNQSLHIWKISVVHVVDVCCEVGWDSSSGSPDVVAGLHGSSHIIP